MENQLELVQEMTEYGTKFQQELPDVSAIQNSLDNEVYKDGALSRKLKELIALAIALHVGCTGCIIYRTKMAVEAGATKSEVLETVSVAINMGGNTALAHRWRVIKVLEELGKW